MTAYILEVETLSGGWSPHAAHRATPLDILQRAQRIADRDSVVVRIVDADTLIIIRVVRPRGWRRGG